MNDELEGACKEGIMAYTPSIFLERVRCATAGVLAERLEPSTTRIQVKNFTAMPTRPVLLTS
jgi:hypothetical protein